LLEKEDDSVGWAVWAGTGPKGRCSCWAGFRRGWTGNSWADVEINQGKRRNGLSVAGLEKENL
jgi:hypothetical protein